VNANGYNVDDVITGDEVIGATQGIADSTTVKDFIHSHCGNNVIQLNFEKKKKRSDITSQKSMR
jgi:hypothetical protein